MNAAKYLSPAELAAFSAELALVVKSGIPITESVTILRDDSETKYAKKLLTEILNVLEQGNHLSEALKKSGAFPPYMTQMVEIGESSGRLDQVLDALTKYYTRDDNISKSARSAVTYPGVMLAILLTIVLVLVVKVLPIFNQVFQSLGGRMSPFAEGAMALGDAISNSSLGILAVIVAIIIAAILLRFIPAGRRMIVAFGRGVFRKLSLKMAESKFSSAMALMLASGLDIDKSLGLALPMIENPRMYGRVAKLQDSVRAGKGFPESSVEANVFTGMQAHLMNLGFKTGNIDGVMEQIAQSAETEVDDKLDTLLSIIEPTMVAILCIIVGLILLSAMLPLLAVMSSIM